MAELKSLQALFTVVLFFVCVSANEIVYKINEEHEPGFRIGNVSRDSNISLSGQILNNLQFSFVSGAEDVRYFTINNRTGLLYTGQKLDRDGRCGFTENCVFQFSITMQSGSFLQSVGIKVYLLDINDNSPQFRDQTYSLVIPESVSVGKSYSLPQAEDRDLGLNSIQNYTMENSNSHFSLRVYEVIGRLKANLVVDRKLDREKEGHYEIIVLAVDGGTPPKTGRLVVNVTIGDDNDNSPVFSEQNYYVNVSETVGVNSTIINVSATDDDAGSNGDVVYKLSRQQQSVDVESTFQIDHRTGKITPSRTLKHLQGETIKVVVEALDSNPEPRMAQANVYITVLDTVNNRPQIRFNVFNDGRVPEDANFGDIVAHVIVTDEDSGNNGMVNCSVNSPLFRLTEMGENEYKMTVSANLDRETLPRLNVTISCQDLGTSPLSSFITFEVTLTDVNDNFPVFEQSRYLFSIFENNKASDLIGIVNATDVDEGLNKKMSYKVAQRDQNVLDYISVDEATGEIRARVSLDRETVDHFNFTVVASDKGVPPLSASTFVYINIKDQNDNTPTFPDGEYILNIYENQPKYSIVGVVVASDPDLGDSGKVSYFLENMDNRSIPFNVSERGSVMALDTFDREVREVYMFSVIARDHGNPANEQSVRVHVHIQDENDNAPVIQFPNSVNQIVRIAYQSPPGSSVTRINATDADAGMNSKLTYRMELNNKLFSIEKNTGTVFVDKNLDHTDCGTHLAYVWASDEGDPVKTSSGQALEIVVFMGNTTAVSASTGEQNALIVIVLLCVTVIVAAVVLSVVLKLRRSDRQKKAANSSLQMENLSQGPPSYQDVTDSGFIDMKTYTEINPGVRGEGQKPPRSKQESKEDLILFKMQLAEEYKQRERHHHVESPSQLPHAEHHQMANERDDVTGPNETRMVAMKVQQALMQCSQRAPQHNQPIRNKPNQNNDNVADEILSDTSGETTGTDSGRGFSEEDSHSQGRSSLPSETDENCFSNTRPANTNYDNSQTAETPPHRFQFHRHSTPPFSNEKNSLHSTSILRNEPRCQTMNVTASRDRSDKSKTHTVHFDSTPYHIEPSYHKPHEYSGDFSLSNRNLVFRKGSTGFSIDVLNDSVDDDNTTTSGSYTIDHEDIRDDVIVFGLQDVYV